MILAYFTPEVVLPIASVVTAAVGFIMMVGRAPFRFAARAWRSGFRGLRKSGARSNPDRIIPGSEPGLDDVGGPPTIGP